MARCEFATWRPIDPAFLPKSTMAAYNRINLHVTAGKGSPFGTFNKTGAASSHFHIFKTGAIEQFVDTAMRAEADLDGNDATISIETEGAAPGVDANAEPWTPEQVASIVRLCQWIISTHGIKAQLAHDSKIGESSKGISWHRLGIDGNFDAAHPGRRQLGGGMHYSTSSGKACPGNAKIDQIPGIVAQLQGAAIPASNPVSAVPAPAPAPAPVKPGRDVGQSVATQNAVRVSADGFWGDDTDQSVNILRAAINGQFPAGVKAAQRVVGARQDGIWGRDSKAALRATIAALQRAWGAGADGIWGAETEAAWQRARALNYKNW
jgi:hypothetical protein